MRSTTRASSAFSSVRCWVGSSSSSTIRTSAPERLYSSFSSSSFPLPTYVRRSGRARCWISSPPGSTPAVRISSRSSASSSSSSMPCASTASTNPRSGSLPGVGSGSALRHRGIIAQEMNAETLAQRTLELVDIPSVSRDEAAIAALRRRGGAARARLRRRRLGSVHDSAAPPIGSSSCSPVTSTRCRRRRTFPGRREGGAVVGLGASDMKGGLAVMIELARWAAEAARPDLRPRLPLLPARGDRARGERTARLLRGLPAALRGGARARCSSRPTTRSRPAASATSRRGSSSAGRARTRRARGSG